MYKSTILTVIATLFLTACGSGSGENNIGKSNEDDTISVKMVKDQIYTISSGQSIKKESSSTEVLIETDTSTGETTATLKSGAASLITTNK